jgi:hypothetical protein
MRPVSYSPMSSVDLALGEVKRTFVEGGVVGQLQIAQLVLTLLLRVIKLCLGKYTLGFSPALTPSRRILVRYD